MNYSRRILSTVVVIVAIFGLWQLLLQPLAISRSGSSSPTSSCAREYNPVCGADGVTYLNACVATQDHKVAIATQGACPPQSSLSDTERKYLFWLLRARMEQKLPDVKIRLEHATNGDCADCGSYYYVWGDPQVFARVIVEKGRIISAIDTTGYDYLAEQQGSPTVFSDL